MVIIVLRACGCVGMVNGLIFQSKKDLLCWAPFYQWDLICRAEHQRLNKAEEMVTGWWNRHVHVLTPDIQRLAKHGPCPTRASVFNQWMKEVCWEIKEWRWRADAPPPSLFGKFICLPLIYCARINLCLPNQWTQERTLMVERGAKDTKVCEHLQSCMQLMLTRDTDISLHFTMDLSPCVKSFGFHRQCGHCGF